MQIKLDSFLDYQYLGQLSLAPNGQKLAFVVGKANLKKNGYDKQLWLYDKETKKSSPFTSKEFSGFYGFDGDTILFTATRERPENKEEEKSFFSADLYSLALDGGEAQFITKLPFRPSKLMSLNDDQLIFMGAWRKPEEDTEKISDQTEKAALEASVKVIDEIPFWANNVGFVNKVRNRLFSYSKSTGEFKALTGEFTNVISFEIDPNKGQVAYLSSNYTDVLEPYQELHLLDLQNGQDQILREDFNCHYSYFAFLNERKFVFTASDGKIHGRNQDHDIYTLDRVSGEVKQISPEGWDVSMWNSVGSDVRLIGGASQKVDDGKFYFATTEFDHSYLNVIDEEGNLKKLTSEKGSVDSFDVLNGEIYAVLLRGLDLQEIYKVEGGLELALTDLNKEESRLRRAKLDEFDFQLNSTNYTGYVLLPSDYDDNKKYPGLLSIHGGPKTAYGSVFFHELHYLAERGYIVFFTNPRGSDGRGRDFSDIRGKYGTIDYEDLMDFTDLILEKYPAIDSEKLGVMGGSYGGFMTNWIIGHTQRFAAACSQRSISNWVSKFGITDIGYYFNSDQQQATPWENFDHFWEVSPLKHAPNAKTPTLFIHSDEDYRCHYSCAMQMHTALKLHGVTSRLVLFHGENHELSRSGKPKERIRRLKEIENWFDKYLMDKDVELY
ncbi:MAG: S9 family peptidase [Tissierellia bacterium]|nr:S9 family peptidase [Tissierellia bacterium]